MASCRERGVFCSVLYLKFCAESWEQFLWSILSPDSLSVGMNEVGKIGRCSKVCDLLVTWQKSACAVHVQDAVLLPSESQRRGGSASDLGKLPALLLNDLIPQADVLWLWPSKHGKYLPHSETKSTRVLGFKIKDSQADETSLGCWAAFTLATQAFHKEFVFKAWWDLFSLALDYFFPLLLSFVLLNLKAK